MVSALMAKAMLKPARSVDKPAAANRLRVCYLYALCVKKIAQTFGVVELGAARDR